MNIPIEVVSTTDGTFMIERGRVKGPVREYPNPEGTKAIKAARRKRRRAVKLARRKNRK